MIKSLSNSTNNKNFLTIRELLNSLPQLHNRFTWISLSQLSHRLNFNPRVFLPIFSRENRLNIVDKIALNLAQNHIFQRSPGFLLLRRVMISLKGLVKVGVSWIQKNNLTQFYSLFAPYWGFHSYCQYPPATKVRNKLSSRLLLKLSNSPNKLTIKDHFRFRNVFQLQMHFAFKQINFNE